MKKNWFLWIGILLLITAGLSSCNSEDDDIVVSSTSLYAIIKPAEAQLIDTASTGTPHMTTSESCTSTMNMKAMMNIRLKHSSTMLMSPFESISDTDSVRHPILFRRHFPVRCQT